MFVDSITPLMQAHCKSIRVHFCIDCTDCLRLYKQNVYFSITQQAKYKNVHIILAHEYIQRSDKVCCPLDSN